MKRQIISVKETPQYRLLCYNGSLFPISLVKYLFKSSHYVFSRTENFKPDCYTDLLVRFTYLNKW